MAQNLGNLFIDGESVIEDETGNHSITNNGTAINSVYKKFGNSSLSFQPASQSNLDIPTSTDFNFGTGEWTVDLWVYMTGDESFYPLVNTDYSPGNWNIWYATDTNRVSVYNDGGSAKLTVNALGDLKNAWHHIAVLRRSGIIYLYVDGVEKGSVGNTQSWDSTSSLTIGAEVSWNRYFSGYMDNIRVTKGTALWTSDFDLTEADLFYTAATTPEEPNPYVRPDTISGLFNVVGPSGNIRGKAAEGFVRPTLKQFFMSVPDFEEIVKVITYTDDLCVGGTAYAPFWYNYNHDNPDYRDNYDAAKAFDDNPATHFFNEWDSLPVYIRYTFSEAKTIRRYTITTDSAGYAYAPRDFTFQGSNDGSNWDILDTKTDEAWLTAKSIYDVDNNTSYLYYRIHITAMLATSGSTNITIKEIEMMEEN
jgi:hypothetical protein